MKKFMKLFPAALALVAFASCSTEDLFDSNKQQTAENELTVNVEQFDNVNATRAVREWKGSVLNFQDGDEIRVYDKDLFKFDIYSFADSKFTRSNATSNITTVEYAAFPAADVKRGYFEVDGTVKLEMSIPATITYDETSEDLVGDKIAYASNLPMWGTAQKDGDGAKADLYHLTGVLAIQVKNMLQNVDALVLTSATKDISGTFVATLDAENPTSVKLEKGGEDLITSNTITIDLTSVPSQVSVIYVPVLDGVSDLQVWADNDGDGIVDEKVADYNSTYTFQRNKFKTLTAEFGIGSKTPGQLSALLNAYQNTLEDNLTIDLENFYVGTIGGGTDANYDGSSVIEVPAADADITINFKAGMTYGNVDGASPLEIKDADPGDPYTGTLTFNVDNLLSAATDITIDLPKANVVLAGDFATNCASSAIQFLAAKSLTIGDGKTTTAIESDGTTDFVFSDVANSVGVTELTIAPMATLTTANPVLFDQFTKTINVDGIYNGDIDFFDNYSLFTVNIKGDASAAAKVNGDIWTIGNVNIDLTKEGEAVTGTLHMAGAEKTLTLKNGYVNIIENGVIVYGTWQKPENNIVFDDANGLVAFTTLTDMDATAGYHNGLDCIKSETKWDASTWNGKKITNATYQAFATYTTNDGTANTNAIFTAAQFASKAVTAASALWNDIDLNSKDWTGQSISNGLDGKKHTISNVNLKNGQSNGLFMTATAALTIKDLIVDGVSYKAKDWRDNIGGLLSRSTAALTINNVNVKGINLSGDIQTCNNIGGIVGQATAAVNLTNAKVAGTIDGYSCLGGFIGQAQGDVDIKTSDCSAINFKQTVNSGKTMDILYAKVGGAIGNVMSGADITIDAATKAPESINYDKADVMYVSDTSSENGDFYSFSANTTTPQLFVGYCGNPNTGYTIGTLNIGTAPAVKTFAKPGIFTGNGQKDSYVVGPTTFYNIYKWVNK